MRTGKAPTRRKCARVCDVSAFCGRAVATCRRDGGSAGGGGGGGGGSCDVDQGDCLGSAAGDPEASRGQGAAGHREACRGSVLGERGGGADGGPVDVALPPQVVRRFG